MTLNYTQMLPDVCVPPMTINGINIPRDGQTRKLCIKLDPFPSLTNHPIKLANVTSFIFFIFS